ncbi:MAG: hypothetical protein JWN23_2029 [Rhodocyclales bacterium]|nr:hypothetical protein [Rhodocyclales bacterium]
MLMRFIKSAFTRKISHLSQSPTQLSPLQKANQFNEQGDRRSAITEYRKHLEAFPHDVPALNNLGCCLVDIGDNEGAAKLFELAFALDDSFLPVVINHAKLLNDLYRSDEGLVFLRQAKASNENFPNVNAVYAGAALQKGDTKLARQHTLKAWLTSFDTLRFANCHLFYCAYADIDEAQLAAEHRFWSATLAPLTKRADEVPPEVPDLAPRKTPGRVRIGYWSPDFRNHSVRYFARPLLENHDHEKFEVFIYYDFPISDAQTENIKANADRFFSVSELSDTKLFSLIRSHELDVLVELAGHSSANRLNLLQERLATLQLTGLGYPPTTGLSTIDGKLLDAHMIDADSSRYYTETPMVLPTSFWCFDPKEDVSIVAEPPVERNGYFTFACVGNIAKINTRILLCWANILCRVPDSKLVLRSISFGDPAAEEYMCRRLEEADIALDRVEFHKPAAGTAYFESYNDIDIILDTYPFNGGTTTCFATYMGVPAVSMAGKSLISRMGQSILNNLELSDWVVGNEAEYVERAVAGAHDVAFLKRFRIEARERFARTALGNGDLFAREFEAACISMLEAKRAAILNKTSQVDTLPAQEILQRAYAVFRFGQNEAAKRIVDHCLSAYPDCGTAHILWTQRLTTEGRFEAAANYLLERLSRFTPNEQIAALVNVARFYLQADCVQKARDAIVHAQTIETKDLYDLLQIRMLNVCIQARDYDQNALVTQPALPKRIQIDVYIICNDETVFQSMRTGIEARCQLPHGLYVNFFQCRENRKEPTYNQAIYESSADLVLWMHKNIEIHSPNFFGDVVAALEYCDILSFAGARRWERMDWRLSESENKAASFLVPSGEKSGNYEVQVMGSNLQRVVENMCVLDGSLMVIRRASLEQRERIQFDALLEGGAALMEEDFSHKAYQAGLQLAVHQNLGLIMDWQTSLLTEHLEEARWQLAQGLGLDPFAADQKEDRTIISTPVSTPAEGVAVQRLFFKD